MKESFAKYSDTKRKLKEIVAYLDVVEVTPDSPIDWDSILDNVQSQFSWMNSDIQNLYSIFYQHLDGHLPPINSATQMQAALEALGLAGDYDVKKQTIYASDGKLVKDVFTVEVTK